VETARVESLGEFRGAIDRGEAKVGLMIPEDFSRNLAAGIPAPVQFVVDGSDSNTASIAIGNIAAIGRSLDLAPRDLQPQPLVTSRRDNPPPMELRTWVWVQPGTPELNFLVPGLTAVIL
jgi:ABC-2 type transport system permease protein